MVIDILTLSAVLILIGLIYWLFHREIGISVSLSRASERSLEDERNGLERRISERTEKFIDSEAKRLQEMERIARFGELSQGLFHDLMSPLSSVSLYVERLDGEGARTAEAKDIIEKAINASNRMRSFMESVRHGIGTGMPRSEKASADLGDEISIARDLLAFKARSAGVTIRIGSVPSVRILIHPMRLHQVFLNLISNAIDACAERSRLEHSDDERMVRISAVIIGREIEISVSDDGCGITPDQISRAFKTPFTAKKDGTGIGLMTVKTIVRDELGGLIRIESGAGKGTAFILAIPFEREAGTD